MCKVQECIPTVFFFFFGNRCWCGLLVVAAVVYFRVALLVVCVVAVPSFCRFTGFDVNVFSHLVLGFFAVQNEKPNLIIF